MKPRTIRLRIALAAGLLSSLVVILFAGLSAWRFYHEQIDVFETDSPMALTPQHLAEAREEVSELAAAYLLALPFVAALAAAGAWWLAGYLTRPLTQLADHAEKMDARTLHERLPESPDHDEISRLARVMNGLFGRLEKSFVQASRFAADASHELRTPLAISRGSLEQAIQADPSGSSTPVLVQLLEENQRLASIVDKLLLLARADAEKLIASYEPVALSNMLEDIADDSAILARPRGITLEARIPASLSVPGDRALLHQLFMNLFDNAVKYSDTNGWVKAQLEQVGPDAVFSLSNSGPIITPDTQGRLFERFFRASEARDRPSGGVGLGLSICREIASAHRGRLELVFSDQGVTMFRLHLPLA